MHIISVIFAAFWAVLLLAEPAHAGPITGFFAAVKAVGLASAIASTAWAAGLLKIGVSIALSALSTALMGKPRSSGIQTDTTQEGGTLSQSFIVGRYATAGTRIAPRMTFGSNNRDMFDVIQISDMPITGISRIAINGQWEPMNTGVSWDGIEFDAAGDLYAADIFTGSQTAASPRLMLKFSSGVERPWQSDMIGRNMAYAVMYHYFEKEVHSGWPEPLFEVQGIRLYDPRKDSTIGGSGAHRWNNKATWEWTENPVVIIYNILRGIELPDGRVWGGKCDEEDLPLSVWAAAANKCDELVTLAGGGTQARYRCGFEIKVADDEPAEIIEELLKSCAGSIVEIGGTYKIRAHGPGLPVYFFSDDDLLVTSGHEFNPFPGLAETYNTINASYPEPSSLWESHDAPERTNATWVTEDQGRVLPVSVSLPAVPIRQQVQRLMLAWLKDNRRWRRHTIILGHYAAGIEPLDVVAWTSERNGYITKHFDVAQVVENAALVQQWEIREVDPTDYDWSSDFELPTYVPSVLPDVKVYQPVPGWSVTPTSIRDGSGAERRPALRFGWTAADIDSPAIRVQIRVQGQADIQGFSIVDVDAGALLYAEGIIPDTTYQARARLRQDGPTEWTAWVNATTPAVGIGEEDLEGDLMDRFEEIALEAGVTPVAVLPASGSKPNQLVMLIPPGQLYRWDATAGEWVTEVYAGIEPGSLGAADFAADVRPVEIVATLPATGNFVGRVAFLTTDGKMYRHLGSPSDVSGWTAAVPAVDLTGQIVATQISDGAISTPKLQANAVEADNIAANAITSGKIAANAVTAGKIQAGAVSADQLAAGAVIASKIAVTDFQSLVPDSEMDTGEPSSAGAVWGKYGGYDTYCTFGEQGVDFTPMAGAENARYAVRISPIPFAGQAAGINTFGEHNRFTAEAGQEYYISMKCWLGSGTALMRCSVSWRDRDGNEISAANCPLVTITTPGQWVEVGGTLTAPPGAVRGIARYVRTADDANVGNVFIARPRVARRNAGELIVDGTVTANHINAGAITTDKIAANAIVASKLATGELITLSAQIKDAIIIRAKIANLAVNTLKIDDDAVSVILSNTGNPTTSAGGINITINPTYAARLVVLATASDLQMITGITQMRVKWNGTTVESANYGGFDGSEASSMTITHTRTVAGGSGPHTLRAEAGAGARASGDTTLTMIAILTYK
jgi:hypothetical protein